LGVLEAEEDIYAELVGEPVKIFGEALDKKNVPEMEEVCVDEDERNEVAVPGTAPGP